MGIWDFSNLEKDSFCTDEIVELIRSAVDELAEFTKGTVTAEFEVIENIPGSLSIMASTIADSLVGERNKVSYQNSENLEDANALYKGVWYGFEIHNNTYKFRVFDIEIMPVFPVLIKIDEDIFDDEKHELIDRGYYNEDRKCLEIYSSSEFNYILKVVLNSRKVMTIISRLMANDSADE